VTAPNPHGETSTRLDPGGLVTTVDGSTFCLSGRTGDVAGEPQGLFFLDARLASRFELRIDGRALESLSVASDLPFHADFVLRQAAQQGRRVQDLLVLRRRWVGQGMREDVELRNHGRMPISARVEYRVDADFADLFVVKGSRLGSAPPSPGQLLRTWGNGALRFAFVRGDKEREVVIEADPTGTAYPDALGWDVTVAPGGTWRATLTLSVLVDGVPVPPAHPADQPVERSVTALRRQLWRTRITRIDTADEQLGSVLAQTVEDLGALLMADPAYPGVPVVAAGAPWYMTLFGRDALLTAWSALLVDSELALGVLETLARLQGRRSDPGTGEQPGRILHEVRSTESPSRRFDEADIYYGTVDAPALFVMLLGEVHRWGIAPDRVRALVPAADRCLAWMERIADADGFVAYDRSDEDTRLRNQGWKDSDDGILHADGHMPVPPIALCEVQAYRHAALLARAEIAAAAGDHEVAAHRRRCAADLRAAFQQRFWLADRGWYAVAVDGRRNPVDALTSNMGHALWAGVVDDEHARRVADQLLSPPLFTGWGIRTLARSMAAYNPISYHNGSVWPHDTALAVAGLSRYGLTEAARSVAEALLAAAQHHGNRLPELFAGLDRTDVPVPVSYPSSCIPQAWAAVAPLLILRSLLRFDPDVPAGRVYIAPAVPAQWLPLRLDSLRIGGADVSLEVDVGGKVAISGLPEGIVIAGARSGN
jgi:glycogen debranching enzyme